MRTTALVRRPGPRLTDGLITHIERLPLDLDLARRQWEAYTEALVSSGWDLVEVPPADDCPDAVFVEDTVVAFRDVAVLARPGAGERRPEVAGTEEVLTARGTRLYRVAAPGTLDGGDVLKIGDTVYVGEGGRTNAEGIAQLGGFLEPLGATVVTVPVRRVLHLKSAVTALPDGTVVGFPPHVDDPAAFDRFLPVPEESGAHVVVLDDDRVLMAADAPASAELFTSLGYRPVTVDISEFQKREGCVTCLSVRLRPVS